MKSKMKGAVFSRNLRLGHTSEGQADGAAFHDREPTLWHRHPGHAVLTINRDYQTATTLPSIDHRRRSVDTQRALVNCQPTPMSRKSVSITCSHRIWLDGGGWELMQF